MKIKIDIPESVEALSELLGLDPLYVANEGKVIVIASAQMRWIVEEMQRHPLGSRAHIIGEIHKDNPGKVHLKTVIGTKRLMTMLSGEQLPRIC
jgi:hydrogenase expression/formation protein HypE